VDTAQLQYEVLPADWSLRAVPLAVGKHKLRVEYVPAGFVPGKWVSLVSWAAFIFLAASWFGRSKKALQ
jgi:uncharacterized membrane protein YfhO